MRQKMIDVGLRGVIAGLVCALLLLACSTQPTPVRAADDETANIAQGVAQGYRYDRQTAVFRASTAAADTPLDTVSVLTTPEFGVNGRSNVSVSAHFSNAAATVTVRYYAYYKDTAGTNTLLGISDEVTLTASAVRDAVSSGRYVAPSYIFDSFGANAARIIITSAPSAGTVTLWVGSY